MGPKTEIYSINLERGTATGGGRWGQSSFAGGGVARPAVDAAALMFLLWFPSSSESRL